MPLELKRKQGEQVLLSIDGQIICTIKVHRCRDSHTSLIFWAPQTVKIDREEIARAKEKKLS